MQQAARRRRWWLVCAAMLCGVAAWSLQCSPAAAAAERASNDVGPLVLDDPLEPLDPKQRRDEADEDHLRALTFFGLGRVAQQRDDFPRALRAYERALRYDPSARLALEELLAIAISLGRIDEAARYVLHAECVEPNDALLLRRLASHLTAEGAFETALDLYDKSVVLRAGKKPTVDDVVVAFQAGKLALAVGREATAEKHFLAVWEALRDPKQYGIDDRVRKLLLSDAAKTFELFVDSESGRSRSPESRGYRFFAEIAIDAEQPAAARAALQRVWGETPSAAERGFDEARLLLLEGKVEEALARLTEYLQTGDHRWGAEPYRLLAILLEKQKAPRQQLIARLEKLHASQPDNVALTYELARWYYEQQQWEEARTLLEKQPKDKLAFSAYQQLVGIYHREREADKLLETLGHLYGRIRSLAVLGDEGKALVDDEAMVTSLIDALSQHGQNEDDQQPAALRDNMRQAVADVALAAGRVDEAQAIFEQFAEGLDKEKRGAAMLDWALALMAEEAYAEASNVLQTAMREGLLDADAPEPYYYLAGVLEMQGQTDQAVEAARQAVRLAEKKAEASGKPSESYYRLLVREPWVLYHANRLDAAADGYQAIVRQLDGDFSSRVIRATVRDAKMALSNIAALQFDEAASERWLNEVLDEFPHDPSALNDLGYLWADRGVHLKRALRMIQEAVAAEPDNVAYRDSLGWALFRLGRYHDALIELEKAAAGEDPDAVILDHLGDAYAKLDKPQQAREAWQRALEAFERTGNTRHAERVKEKLRRHQAASAESTERSGTSAAKPATNSSTALRSKPVVGQQLQGS